MLKNKNIHLTVSTGYTLQFTVNTVHQCCGSGPFFRIRIRRSGFKNPDPDPGDPKKTETGSGSYLDMFLMFSKKKICMVFLYQIYTSYDT